MKKIGFFIVFIFLTIGLSAQSGVSSFKYELRVPSLRVGGATKVRLDSIVQNADTIKFYNGGTELKSNGAGIWTGTGIRLDTTLARVTLGINNVTNESKATMFNNSSFTGSVRFNDGLYPGLTDLVRQIGTAYGSEWNRFYLSTNGFISWNNSIFLQGSTGQLNLSGGDLSLNANNLYTTGDIGSSSSRINHLYVDSLYTNYATIALAGFAPIDNPSFTGSVHVPALWPTDSGMVDIGHFYHPFKDIYMTDPGNISFGTGAAITASDSVLLLHAWKRVMSTAPFETIEMNHPSVTGMIYPKIDGEATLGHPNFKWAGVYIDSVAAINWGNTGPKITGSKIGSEELLFLNYGSLIIEDHDLGHSSYPVRRGWFTDLNITNRPTVGAASLLLEEDLKTINGESIVGTGDIVITGSGAFTIEADSILVDSIKYSVYKDGEIIPPDIPDGYTDDPYDLFPEIHAFAGDTSNYPVPDKIGNLFINTSASKVYVSVSTSRGGWVILNMILPLLLIVRRRRRK